MGEKTVGCGAVAEKPAEREHDVNVLESHKCDSRVEETNVGRHVQHEGGEPEREKSFF